MCTEEIFCMYPMGCMNNMWLQVESYIWTMYSNWNSTAQHSQIGKNVFTFVNYICCLCSMCALQVLGCRPFFHISLGLAPFLLFLFIRIPSVQNICLSYYRNSLGYAGGKGNVLKNVTGRNYTKHQSFKSSRMQPG